MKLNKATYLSLFFLLCFTTSFSLSNYQNLRNTVSKISLLSKKNFHVSSTEEYTAGNNLILEKNENENESNFEAQAFVLPFLFSFFQSVLSQPKIVSAKPLAEVLQNPIYLSVCNFRI